MRVRRIPFAGRHVHHRQPHRTGRNMSHLRLAEGFADVAELRAAITVVVRITKNVPVRFDVGEADRVALGNFFEAHFDDRGMTRMPSDVTHNLTPLGMFRGPCLAITNGHGTRREDPNVALILLEPFPYK